jgi:hypothetical protein
MHIPRGEALGYGDTCSDDWPYVPLGEGEEGQVITHSDLLAGQSVEQGPSIPRGDDPEYGTGYDRAGDGFIGSPD